MEVLEITGVLNIWWRKSAIDGKNNTLHVKNIVVKWCSWQYCSYFLIPASYLGESLCDLEPHHEARLSILTCSESSSENWLHISNQQKTKISLLVFHNINRHPSALERGIKVFSDEEKLQFRFAINEIT